MEYDVKDMLEIAIDNNDSLWEVAVIDRLQDELERLYSHEAKVKALDGVKELINAHDCAIEEEGGLGHLFLLDLKAIMKYAESGEYDD